MKRGEMNHAETSEKDVSHYNRWKTPTNLLTGHVYVPLMFFPKWGIHNLGSFSFHYGNFKSYP